MRKDLVLVLRVYLREAMQGISILDGHFNLPWHFLKKCSYLGLTSSDPKFDVRPEMFLCLILFVDFFLVVFSCETGSHLCSPGLSQTYNSPSSASKWWNFLRWALVAHTYNPRY
jgi:hypothetical protein